MGDDKADIIAEDLKQTYKELMEDEYACKVGMWSYDIKEESKKRRKMIKALKKTYSYYAVRPIDE